MAHDHGDDFENYNAIMTGANRWARSDKLLSAVRRGVAGLPVGASQPAAAGQPQANPVPQASAPATSAEIKPGMTMDEVFKALGDPKEKVAFGDKAQWVYARVTVIFDRGKVTDVKF